MAKKMSFEAVIAKQCKWACKKTKRESTTIRRFGRTYKTCMKNCKKYYATHGFVPYWRRRRRRK